MRNEWLETMLDARKQRTHSTFRVCDGLAFPKILRPTAQRLQLSSYRIYGVLSDTLYTIFNIPTPQQSHKHPP